MKKVFATLLILVLVLQVIISSATVSTIEDMYNNYDSSIPLEQFFYQVFLTVEETDELSNLPEEIKDWLVHHIVARIYGDQPEAKDFGESRLLLLLDKVAAAGGRSECTNTMIQMDLAAFILNGRPEIAEIFLRNGEDPNRIDQFYKRNSLSKLICDLVIQQMDGKSVTSEQLRGVRLLVEYGVKMPTSWRQFRSILDWNLDSQNYHAAYSVWLQIKP